MGLPQTLALAASLTAGMAFGYVVTTLADVFIG
jgi:hypothetical protein